MSLNNIKHELLENMLYEQSGQELFEYPAILQVFPTKKFIKQSMIFLTGALPLKFSLKIYISINLFVNMNLFICYG